MNVRDIPTVHDAMLEKKVSEDNVNLSKAVKTFVDRPPSLEDGCQDQVLSVEFLKQYLKYCKNSKKMPTLSKDAGEEIGVAYADLRQKQQEAAKNGGNGQLAVTTRTLEAMIRLSTAHPRLRLSDEVTLEDVKVGSFFVFSGGWE